MNERLDLERETRRRLTDHCRAGRVDLALVVLLEAFHRTERKIMSKLDDAIASEKVSLDALKAQQAIDAQKIDALIQLAVDGGATQAQIDAINALGAEADGVTAGMQSEDAKADATLNPPPAPSPAPAPEPAPAPPPTDGS